MAAAIDVARYLIRLAASSGEEDADLLSPLRLQKLLYYAQGWHLALMDAPLFPCRVEAWKYGPVVPDVYHTFKKYGSASLPATEGDNPVTLSSDQKVFLGAIWEKLKRHSATALSAMTHIEPPWMQAGNGGVVTTTSMRTYFASQVGRLTAPRSALRPPEPTQPVSSSDTFIASLGDGVYFARAVAAGGQVDFPHESINLAETVVQRQAARAGEDVNAWARLLASDVAELTD